MRKLCALVLLCSLLFGQTVLAEESEINGTDSMSWWVNWGGTGLGLEFSRVCIDGEYTVCALEENGELWRLYPQVEKVAQDVKKAQGLYYLKENGNFYRCGDDTQPMLSGVDDFSFEMSEGDSCYILKTDHTLWTGSRAGEFTQIDDSVIQITDWGYLKTDGTLIDYNGEQYSKKVEYLTENGRGYYVENDGFYRYAGKEEYDYKLFNLRAVEFAEYWTNAEFAVYRIALTDTGEVWAFPSSQDFQPILLGENAVELGWNGGKVDWRDAEGNMYCIDQKIVPSSELIKIISIRHSRDNVSNKIYDVYYENGNHGYLVRNDTGEEKLLENVCYVVIKQDQTWIQSGEDLDLVTEGRGLAIQTDGSVWDVTETPEKLGVLPVKESLIKGDVTGDGTVNIDDLRMVLRAICGKVSLADQQKSAADVESDNDVNIADLRKILRYTCGKIERL